MICIFHYFLCVKNTMKQLVERYILDRTTLGADSEATVTRSDIMSIRNDIAVFR